MSGPRLLCAGALADLSPAESARLCERAGSDDGAVAARVAGIIARVRQDGDRALVELARELDGVALETLEVPRARPRAALDQLDAPLRAALERAARNLAAAHDAQRPCPIELETEPGVRVGRRPEPLGRVGLYAPGGRARYPSSVLMGAVPARIAGVRELVLCSPPGADGAPAPEILAAAELAGVDRVFSIGGAGAIAALAFGTASVPRVDAIVGPGNAWVAAAKLQVAAQVAIDTPAGPSELLVIADPDADPEAVARELVAQAEHDPEARVVAVAIGPEAAARIAAALDLAMARAPRRAIVEQALARHGAVLWARGLDQAITFANRFAPEHLLLAIADPRAAFEAVRCAGTVCLGLASSVTFGDYLTGANHVLPTGGLARCHSGLSTADFVRWTSWQEVIPAAAARLAGDTAALADAEALPGHAAAARAWNGARAPDPPVPALDLDDNTNRFGTPPAALAALRALPAERLSRYPEANADALVAALARHLGVAAEAIVTGCGSDDVLDAAFRALAAPGDRVAHPDPTFSMVPELIRTNRLRAAPVPLTRDYDHDAGALLAASARLVYLCSPNNPTGTLASAAALERVIDGASGVVILDEAYAEFAGVSRAAMAPARGNLLVVRTLSKAFGLAGLRIGYAVGAPSLVAAVARARGPYKVGAAAERAACAALEQDLAWVEARVAEAVERREDLAAALAGRGIRALPSAANFVLVPVRDACATAGMMARRGVRVRAFTALAGIGDAVRITVGPTAAMERALAALEEALR